MRPKGQATSEKAARAITRNVPTLGRIARSKRFRELETGNGLFGIVQGGMFENLARIFLR
jgi:queuine tRNA-ribosyltransferase